MYSNHFSQVPQSELPRSTFNRSFTHKTSFNAGKLIPVYWEEVLPGDSFNCNVNLFCRMTSPLQVPIMDNMNVDMHFFYVPFRLVWDNFERFMGAQDNPDDSTDYLFPTLVTSSSAPAGVGSLTDYFGLPIGVGGISYNSLIFRAYWLIWNEWYRDQNLQDSAPVQKDDTGTFWTSDTPINGDMYPWDVAPRNKRHDYFTSCLPWPQKGPGVELPLGGTAAFVGTASTTLSSTSSPLQFMSSDGKIAQLSSYTHSDDSSGTYENYFQPAYTAGSTDSSSRMWKYMSGIKANTTVEGYTDLSSATAATINSLRQAFQLQRMFERDARGGTRFREILKSHYGVVSPDARVQIPEYLGGFSQPFIVNPVAQTSSTDATSPQASLSAYAVTGASHQGFTKSFVEHGFIIGLVSTRADLNYSQGINRLLSHTTRESIYFPALAHLGEQAVLNKEIFAQGTDADDDVFGYQERWAEYRYHPNMVTGLMRPQADQSLAIWNLTQDFESLPTLNSEFIVENPPMDRVSAVPSQPDFLLDCFFDQKVARVMPTYSVPGLIDHF